MTVLPFKRYRELAGKTRDEVAEQASISVDELYAIEIGKESPTLEKAISIADAIGVDMYTLAREAERKD